MCQKKVAISSFGLIIYSFTISSKQFVGMWSRAYLRRQLRVKRALDIWRKKISFCGCCRHLYWHFLMYAFIVSLTLHIHIYTQNHAD